MNARALAIEAMLQAVGSVAAVAAAFVVCGVLMVAAGADPLAVYWRLFDGVVLNPYGIAQIFFKATPLILAGLSVTFAFKAGLFNVGAEGQMIAGGFLCAWTGFTFTGLPWAIHAPLCLLAAFAGGTAWAAIPGLLKARRGAHEVITTIMMNFIAAAAANWLVTAHFHTHESVHTQAIAPSAWLPRLSAVVPIFKGSPANAALLVALAACVAVWWLLARTPFGYELRAVGSNAEAAAAGGIPVARTVMTAFLVSGGLAGLAGTSFVMGYKHYFEDGFAGGTGFMGIAVALLGRNHPAGIVAAALLFGGLSHGTLVLNALVPKDVVLVLQALVIVLVIAADRIVRRHAAGLTARPAGRG